MGEFYCITKQKVFAVPLSTLKNSGVKMLFKSAEIIGNNIDISNKKSVYKCFEVIISIGAWLNLSQSLQALLDLTKPQP